MKIWLLIAKLFYSNRNHIMLPKLLKYDQEPKQLSVILRFMDKVFKYIKADQFFKDYCPDIKSYNHKMRGFNGRGNPTSFSPEEEKEILKGLDKLFTDMKKKK